MTGSCEVHILHVKRVQVDQDVYVTIALLTQVWGEGGVMLVSGFTYNCSPVNEAGIKLCKGEGSAVF